MGLKFFAEFDNVFIKFLDLQLKGNIMDKSINTVTYRKEVAGNTIVSANSCHPLQTIKAIPCGELTRAKRNCSVTSELDLEMNTVWLKTWGYATWMLD